MICNFPTPYPDEIFYSLCARYSDRVQYTTMHPVLIDLFGHGSAIKVGLPNCLGYLVAHLPPKPAHTVESLIEKHTLLPFYEPFLPISRSHLLRNHMEKDEKKPMHVLTGIRSWCWPSNCTIFCPLCVEEDKKQFGECYWHRVHQIPCVNVCPYHNLYLRDARGYIDNITNRYKFFSAEQIVNQISPNQIEVTSNDCGTFLDIACNALYLLQNPSKESLISIEKRYLFLLAEKGLASYKGRVYTSKIQQEFQQYYGTAILKHFGCELATSTHSNWLARLPHNKALKVFNPVRHLLFIRFMGYDIKTFLTLSIGNSPFGNGPWPCLNPVCKNYKERCISHCKVLYTGGGGRPRGIFSCSCGFTYSRIGPDCSEEDLFQASPVRIYGPVWDAKLKEIWDNSTLSIRSAARIFGTDAGVIRRQAQRLGLLESRIPKHTHSSQIIQNEGHIHPVHLPGSDLLKQYRNSWLLAIEENPDSGMRQLVRNFPRAYQWLRKHDEEWLQTHSPVIENRQVPPHPQMNWSQRDKQLAEDISSFALRIRNTQSRPVFMSFARLISGSSKKDFIWQNLHKLPLTAETINSFVETREECALRRIQWTIECYQWENITPSRTSFVRRAGLAHAQTRWMSVEKGIDDALQILKTNIQ